MPFTSAVLNRDAAFAIIRIAIRKVVYVDDLVTIIISYLEWLCFYELFPYPQLAEYEIYLCLYCYNHFCASHFFSHLGSFCFGCGRTRMCKEDKYHHDCNEEDLNELLIVEDEDGLVGTFLDDRVVLYQR